MCAMWTFKVRRHVVIWSMMSNIVMILIMSRFMVSVMASIVIVLKVIIRRIVGIVVH